MERQEESIFAMLKFAVMPIAKVFVMCFLGFLMASKHVNILTASGRKLLNGLVFTLLLPCLIFTQLGRSVTLQKMIEWWFIPVNVVLAAVFGSLIGLIVASVVRPPPEYFKFTIVQIGIGNIGNVPLVLISALCRDKSNPFGDSDTCNQLGSAYISFGQWVGAVILYTYVFSMLAPPECSVKGNLESGTVGDETRFENLGSARVPLLAQEEGNIDCSPSASVISFPKTKRIIICLSSLVEKLKIKQILQPPIIASVLAMVMGAVPFLKQLVLTDSAPFFFITDSCVILGYGLSCFFIFCLPTYSMESLVSTFHQSWHIQGLECFTGLLECTVVPGYMHAMLMWRLEMPC